MLTPNHESIAHRELTDGNGHTALHVFLGLPRREPSGHYVCTAHFYWTSGTNERVEAHGSDSFQALTNALAAIQKLTSEHKLSWLAEPGSAGFPAAIPLAFGQAWSDAMELLVRQESERELARRKHEAEAKR